MRPNQRTAAERAGAEESEDDGGMARQLKPAVVSNQARNNAVYDRQFHREGLQAGYRRDQQIHRRAGAGPEGM
jgi:hypothetical protein